MSRLIRLAQARLSSEALDIRLGQLVLAGAMTASAVLGDMVAAARNKVDSGRAPGESTYAALPVASMDEVSTRYHVRMRVADKPGVLALVAAEFSRHGVSIAQVRQTEVEFPESELDDSEPTAELTVLTETASWSESAATVASRCSGSGLRTGSASPPTTAAKKWSTPSSVSTRTARSEFLLVQTPRATPRRASSTSACGAGSAARCWTGTAGCR